jgi:hypothetical protein
MEFGPHVEFSDAWAKYVNAVETLWTGERDPQAGRLHLVRYEELAKAAVSLARDARLGLALQEAYVRHLDEPGSAGPARLYVLELNGFADAVGNAPTPKLPGPKESPKDASRDLLEDAGTVADSAKDIFGDLPGWAKATIHGFGEVAKLFKKK